MAQQRVLAKEEYTVGWVCALPLELVAARHMLDEIHAPVQEQDASDHNSYVLGCVSQHNVVVAALPAGVYGNNPAATVAKDMLRSFPSIRFGLLVGIGGAAPSPFHDIRLGDVVVSRPSTTNGGVIQYDRGKLTQQGTFARTGSLNSPPTLLLTTLSNLESLHAGTDSQILPFIEDMFNRFPKLRTQYASPGKAHDHLYQADYQHLANNLTCEACDPRWEVSREPREKDGPEIHYGSIASSNQVVKDAVLRDRLRDELDVLCFEMEAAGLMQDFPCLVVRGICDYADSHKNKRWQEYAAAVAAAYAKEFLSIIPAARVRKENLIMKLKDTLAEYTKDVRQHHHTQAMHNLQQEAHNQQLETYYQSDKHRDCHRAFKTSNYEEHKNVNPDRVKGTCRWVLDHPKFKAWGERPRSDLLWISADPGCGKSVLARSLIDHDLAIVPPTPGYSLCYFFFKDNATQDHLATALCAVLHQLFAQQPSLIRHAVPVWEMTGEHLRDEVDALWRILKDAAADPEMRSLICVLDALDECRDADRARLINKLCDIYNISDESADVRGSLKFLVTSRAYNTIRDGFQAVPESLSSIRLRGEDENDQIHQEIDLVIRERVTEMAKDLKLDTLTKQRVERTLLGMEHRTYLWLHLTIGEMRTRFRSSLRPSQASIDLLPASVEQAYDQILQRISSEQIENVRKIFSIVLGARRALTVAEMAIALGIATDYSTSKHLSDLAIDKDHLERNIQQWCGLFIFVNHSHIYLIHQTAKEFLLQTGNGRLDQSSSWKHCLSPVKNEGIMARICVGFLLIPDLEDYLSEFRLREPTHFEIVVEDEDEDEDDSDNTSGPLDSDNVESLMKYCATHWAYHLRESHTQVDDPFMEMVSMLHNTESMRYKLWFPFFWKAASVYRNPVDMNKLQLAAFNGHDTALQMFLNKGEVDLEAKDSSGRTALSWASGMGHIKAVQVLIEEGADVNAQSGEYGNALQVATNHGHEAIVRLLIEQGADVNAQGGRYGSALQLAIRFDKETILRVLIEKGADVNATDGKDGNALHAASCLGRVRIVQVLLEKGADVNAQGGKYGNALQAASYLGHESIVRLLIEHGADVNAQDGRYNNALEASMIARKKQIVQLLIESGADPQVVSKSGWSPLHVAAFTGCESAVNSLVELVSDVQVRSRDSRMPLHFAAEGGNLAVVNRLIKAGVDLKGMTKHGLTPLHFAASAGHLPVVDRLIELGADFECMTTHGFTPLHFAASAGHLAIVERLIKSDADPGSRSTNGCTPLYEAASNGHFSVVDRLIKQGADINARNSSGSTALHQRFYARSRDEIMRLVERGGDPTLLDGYGRTCLEWSASDSDLLKMFEQLGYSYQPTPAAIRAECLQRSVLQFLGLFKEESEQNDSLPSFHTLGHFLLFLSQHQDALTAFRLQMFYPEGETALVHKVCCDMCNAKLICGVRHVCTECADVDLCSGCFERYKKGVGVPMCRNHEFLEVPPVPWDDDFARDRTKLTRKIKEWLQKLENAAIGALDQINTHNMTVITEEHTSTDDSASSLLVAQVTSTEENEIHEADVRAPPGSKITSGHSQPSGLKRQRTFSASTDHPRPLTTPFQAGHSHFPELQERS